MKTSTAGNLKPFWNNQKMEFMRADNFEVAAEFLMNKED
jgi:hypothetical protein